MSELMFNNAENRVIEPSDRLIRLDMSQRKTLYTKLKEMAGLPQKIEAATKELAKYCEHLYETRVIPGHLGNIYPGCLRLCKTTEFYSVFYDSFDIELPKKSEKESWYRSETREPKVTMEFSKEYIDIVPPEVSCTKWCSDRELRMKKDRNFSELIKKYSTPEEVSIVRYYLRQCLAAIIESNNFLAEYSTKRKSWIGGAIELGVFNTLGQLERFNPEWALIMKYDILGLGKKKEEMKTLAETDTNELVSIAKQLLR